MTDRSMLAMFSSKKFRDECKETLTKVLAQHTGQDITEIESLCILTMFEVGREMIEEKYGEKTKRLSQSRDGEERRLAAEEALKGEKNNGPG